MKLGMRRPRMGLWPGLVLCLMRRLVLLRRLWRLHGEGLIGTPLVGEPSCWMTASAEANWTGERVLWKWRRGENWVCN